jgi:hypothetical protein
LATYIPVFLWALDDGESPYATGGNPSFGSIWG